MAVTPGRPLDWSHARCVGCSCGGFFWSLSKVWAAQRVALPRCACCAGDALVPEYNWLGTTSTAGAGAVELQLVAHLSCDLTGRRLVEKPPGLHLGPDCRSGFRRLSLLSACLLAAAAAHTTPHTGHTHYTTTRRIGWHDANQLRRLDARGDRARPHGGRACPMLPHPRNQQDPSFEACHWMAGYSSFSSLQSSPPLP